MVSVNLGAAVISSGALSMVIFWLAFWFYNSLNETPHSCFLGQEQCFTDRCKKFVSQYYLLHFTYIYIFHLRRWGHVKQPFQSESIWWFNPHHSRVCASFLHLMPLGNSVPIVYSFWRSFHFYKTSALLGFLILEFILHIWILNPRCFYP